MKKKLIVANWKMNSDFDHSDQWFANFIKKYESDKKPFQKTEAIICPPVILIDNMSAHMIDYSLEKFEEKLAKQKKTAEDFKEDELHDMILAHNPISIGAQNCHFEESGAFTGDVSAKMITEIGAQYVILGHSERRIFHLEDSQTIAKKIKAAATHDLIPILCVGESKEVRDQEKHLEFVYKQLLESTPKDAKLRKLVIAYEPIWSIGTGEVPTSKQIKEMVTLIKKITKEKLSEIADEFSILYGGSASLKNCQEILEIPNIDGLLIGKASLNADDFYEICKKASK